MYLNHPNRILRKAEVLHVFGISKSTLYNRINDGTFPPPISIGGSSKGWLESEVSILVKALAANLNNSELKNVISSLIRNRSTGLNEWVNSNG